MKGVNTVILAKSHCSYSVTKIKG